MNKNSAKYWMALKSIDGVGNASFSPLLERFGSLEAVFSAGPAELSQVHGISGKSARAIASFHHWTPILRQLEIMEKIDARIVAFTDEEYPQNLLNIYDRPAFLYVLGRLSPDDIPLAIIGSRNASAYGKYTTERLSRELAMQGIAIVSGMARGVDSCAHRGALTAKGRTIAVLGSGLDVIYPPENNKLFQDIAQNGAVISEYPPGAQPLAYHFPARNRIISGISYGVVIVEAGEKSGSLITARLAIEQGRDVFAIPGAIDSPLSRGANKLIQQGAKLIENINDILEDVIPQLEKRQAHALPPKPKAASNRPAPANQEALPFSPALTNLAEKKIFSILSQGQAHADDIMDQAHLPPAEIFSSLITMELQGIITQSPGKIFSLKK